MVIPGVERLPLSTHRSSSRWGSGLVNHFLRKPHTTVNVHVVGDGKEPVVWPAVQCQMSNTQNQFFIGILLCFNFTSTSESPTYRREGRKEAKKEGREGRREEGKEEGKKAKGPFRTWVIYHLHGIDLSLVVWLSLQRSKDMSSWHCQ